MVRTAPFLEQVDQTLESVRVAGSEVLLLLVLLSLQEAAISSEEHSAHLDFVQYRFFLESIL